MLTQNLFVNSRLIIVSLSKPQGYDFNQVLISLVVFRKEDQMTLILVLIRIFVQHGPGRGVHFTANDRFYALFFALLVEVDYAEHDAVVGNRQRIHPQLFRSGDHIGNPRGAVQQTVLCMNM